MKKSAPKPLFTLLGTLVVQGFEALLCGTDADPVRAFSFSTSAYAPTRLFIPITLVITSANA